MLMVIEEREEETFFSLQFDCDKFMVSTFFSFWQKTDQETTKVGENVIIFWSPFLSHLSLCLSVL
jgi:hypothetical protein